MSSAVFEVDQGVADNTRDVVSDVYDVLRTAVDEGSGGTLLGDLLENVRERHQEFRIDLVVDRESYDGRESFDVLVRDRTGRTISLSISDPAGLPWPLRGVARAGEYDLVQVDGVKMSVQEAMSSIDAIFDDRHVLRTLIDACLLGAELDDAAFEVTEAQLEDASDSFRRARGLQTAAATADWLEQRSLSVEQFSIMIEQQAKIIQLREQLFGEEVDRRLGTGQMSTTVPATLQVAWVAAPRGAETLISGCASTLAADPLAAIVAARREGRSAGLEHWQAADVPVRFSQVLTAAAGDVVVLHGEVAMLAVVLDRAPAADLAGQREALIRRQFGEWLAERRRAARVQWFWGNERRTAPAVLEQQP